MTTSNIDLLMNQCVVCGTIIVRCNIIIITRPIKAAVLSVGPILRRTDDERMPTSLERAGQDGWIRVRSRNLGAWSTTRHAHTAIDRKDRRIFPS